MSKFSKKNKKFKKNVCNNYRCEYLGPRLMMDASADDWNQETQLLDTAAASDYVSSPEYQKWANTNIRTLLSLNASDIASLKQVMSSASQIAKSSYRQILLNTAPFQALLAIDPNNLGGCGKTKV